MLIDGIKLEDIGLAEVTIGDATLQVDVLRVNNRLAELAQQHKDKPIDEHNEAVAAYLQELGFPHCTHYLAVLFAQAIAERTRQLQQTLKNVLSAEPKPGSAASMESTPSN